MKVFLNAKSLKDKWPDYLSEIVEAVNKTPLIMGRSSSDIILSREDLFYNRRSNLNFDTDDLKFEQTLLDDHSAKRIQEFKLKRKKYYEVAKKNEPFKEGDIVFVKNKIKSPLMKGTTGPYKVLEVTHGNKMCKLVDLKTRNSFSLSSENLRKLNMTEFILTLNTYELGKDFKLRINDPNNEKPKSKEYIPLD